MSKILEILKDLSEIQKKLNDFEELKNILKYIPDNKHSIESGSGKITINREDRTRIYYILYEE